MIGIIAAMAEELNEVLALMSDWKQEEKFGVQFYPGKLANKDVVLMLSGVAKINASFSTTLLLSSYPISHVINVGSAGGLKTGLKILDVVVSTRVAQHDLDVGRAKGELGGQPRFFPADLDLVKKAEYLNIQEAVIHRGLIVSGDQFIVSSAAGSIIQDFPDAICVEMEAGAVGQVCSKMQVPFVVIRSISDLPTHADNNLTFEEYLKKAARHSALMAQQLVAMI